MTAALTTSSTENDTAKLNSKDSDLNYQESATNQSNKSINDVKENESRSIILNEEHLNKQVNNSQANGMIGPNSVFLHECMSRDRARLASIQKVGDIQ